MPVKLRGIAVRSLVVATLAAAALLAVACAKKPPATPADLVSSDRDFATSTPPRASQPGGSPAARDPGPAIWTRDLEEINRYVREQGLLADVYFDFDRAEIRSDTREQLTKNALFLTDRPDFEVTIEGHCDERGTTEYNLVLGESRARAAVNYLATQGVPAERVRVVTLGEETPVCRESQEDCWWRNRRAHFYISSRSSGR